MTHSLHRRGSEPSLKKDFVVLSCLAKNLNRESPEAREKLIKIGEILNENHPVNIIRESAWKISPVVTAVYNDINQVKSIIRTLKEADLGISIVISGLISDIQNLMNEVNLSMHSIHLSLGVFGKKELLPSKEKILEITTMCGHHCISPQSVENYVELIKEEKITIEKAAQNLAKPCICGIFNHSRAEELLNELIPK